MTVTLIHGNALTIPLADQSVHLIVTSPPYWKARDYRDGGESVEGQLGDESSPHLFLAHLWAVLDECWRILRDDGNLWLNLGDKIIDDRRVSGGLRIKCRALIPHRFAHGLIDPDERQYTEQRAGLAPTADPPQWICRMDVCWAKPNGLPESVTDRVRASHEYWFHLVKSERYYAAVDEIREEQQSVDKPGERRSYTAAGHDPHGAFRVRQTWMGLPLNPLGKLPGSVWTVPTEPLRIPDDLPQHFAAFPSEFPRRLILGWSPSGVCVACGQGRRPVCERTGRIVSSHGGDAPTHAVDRPYERRIERQVNGVGGHHFGKHEATIVGTACGCPTPTAPITPAVVLDPFSGTGTTAIVADALGRHGIGVDLSWDYHRIARWRHQDGGLRAKALDVERPAKELDGQLSLLGEAS